MFTRTIVLATALLVLLSRETLQETPASADYYVAAVVEYHPIVPDDAHKDAAKVAEENANNYATFMKKAINHDVDIIVFPEDSLTTMSNTSDRSKHLALATVVPDPAKEADSVLCDNPKTKVIQALKSISCAAKATRLNVVVNVAEKEECKGRTDCPADDFFLYNTNVVFDRTGKIIARYRKINLYGSDSFNTTAKPELSTFKTDFGVTFGQVICFDILFEEPSLKLVKEKKVTDIIFSSHWFSELPHLTGVQEQAAWAFATDTNLLAAGYNQPKTGSGGSGIYAGKRGPFTRTWAEIRQNALMVAKVPKVINGNRQSKVGPNEASVHFLGEVQTAKGPEPVSQQQLLMDPTPRVTKLIDINKKELQSDKLCHNDFCCDFTVMINNSGDIVKNTNDTFYRYRLAIFNGVRGFTDPKAKTTGVMHCSIISCLDDTEKSCGKRFEASQKIYYPLTFMKATIKANFSNTILKGPNSLTTSIVPLERSDFEYTERTLPENKVEATLTLLRTQKEMMTFAIYARNFENDGKEVTRSSATAAAPWFLSVLCLAVLSNSVYFYNA